MHRAFLALVFAFLVVPLAPLSLAGCAKDGAPEQVADAFAQAYFARMDQEKAKEYTALGATAMLEKELRDVAEIRKEGYTPAQAHSDVSLRRGESTTREQRIRVPYEVVVRAGDSETIRDADVELAQIQGVWKVVRVGLKTREPEASATTRPTP